jgi:hypothetical protein
MLLGKLANIIIDYNNNMISKYFNCLTEASFKKDNDGNTLFFPWGIYGKGRIITDELIKRKVRSFIGIYHIVSFSASIFTVIFLGWAWLFLLVPVSIVWFHLAIKSLLSGCRYSEVKLSFRESLTKSAKMFNKFTLWLLLLGSFLFVVTGIIVLIIAKSTSDLLVGISSIIVFGTCTILYAYMLNLKKT